MREAAYVVFRAEDGPGDSRFVVGVAASPALAEDIINEYRARPTLWCDKQTPVRRDRFDIEAFDFRRVRAA